jgi:ribosome-binding protein aMBF1 (putative translation factor)
MPDTPRGPAMTDRRLDDRLLFAAEREADGLAPREDLAELLMEARAVIRRIREARGEP